MQRRSPIRRHPSLEIFTSCTAGESRTPQPAFWVPGTLNDSIRIEGRYIASFYDGNCSHPCMDTYQHKISFIHCSFFLRFSTRSSICTPLSNKIRVDSNYGLSVMCFVIFPHFYVSSQLKLAQTTRVWNILDIHPSVGIAHAMISTPYKPGIKAPRH